jgi:Zn-dependent peptidase ImmA (M78 family)/transcriptional regulator with XRE-family HTH domain
VPTSVIFEPDRLRQARQLAMLTKREVAEASGVSPAAVGQYEAGVAVPRPETISRLAVALDVPEDFFGSGRPLQRLETSETYFESLRATTAKQRQHATAFAEQIWELAHALETHVRVPALNLPSWDEYGPTMWTARQAAQAVRARWGLGVEPVGHLVSHLEANGVICALAPPTEQAVARIDAYSTLAFGRPLTILTPDRADDVYRHRFSVAHELGHLVLHGGEPSGEVSLEREADSFAAELLTPRDAIRDALPSRMDFNAMFRLGERWGVSVRMLIYRSQELGLVSESTARRAYIRLAQTEQPPRPIRMHSGEVPSMLRAAFELAETRGLTVVELATQLGWKPRRVRQLLGDDDPRPELKIVTTGR